MLKERGSLRPELPAGCPARGGEGLARGSFAKWRGPRIMRLMLFARTKPVWLFLLLFLVLAGCAQAETSPTRATSTPAASVVPTGTATRATALPSVTRPAATPVPSATVVPFAPPDLRYLDAAFQEALEAFTAGSGTLASYYVADLRSGQTIAHNEGVAISGMSMVKIPILVEVYRRLDVAPAAAETTLITETATLSGNYTANLLLELIAARPDPFAGAAELTAALRRLGLYDTFIAVPYDLEPRAGYLPTYATLANQREISTNPDSSMQTTTEDLGRLLTWIYRCTEGEGPLVETDPGALTAAECREMVDVMAQNKIEAFIEAGVPAGVPVAHKHGWVAETHGDAGIVLAPEQPYVLVIALHRPGWLEWAESTELIAGVSRLAYAHFTDPAAYAQARLATPLPPLPPATATPALPQAVVVGTQGAGLTLRETPGGTEVLVLPEGMRLYLLQEEPVTAGEVIWRKVAAPDGSEGWVGEGFLEMED